MLYGPLKILQIKCIVKFRYLSIFIVLSSDMKISKLRHFSAIIDVILYYLKNFFKLIFQNDSKFYLSTRLYSADTFRSLVFCVCASTPDIFCLEHVFSSACHLCLVLLNKQIQNNVGHPEWSKPVSIPFVCDQDFVVDRKNQTKPDIDQSDFNQQRMRLSSVRIYQMKRWLM